MPARGTECQCGIIRTCTQAGQSLPECENIEYSDIGYIGSKSTGFYRPGT